MQLAHRYGSSVVTHAIRHSRRRTGAIFGSSFLAMALGKGNSRIVRTTANFWCTTGTTHSEAVV
jgi:hypothetical protein